MRSDKRGALLVAVVLVASAVLGGIYGPSVRATAAGATDLQDSVKTFTQVLTVVQQNYAVPINTDKSVYDGAIPGMLRTLDPHSIFFDPRQFSQMREDQEAHYYGVGMYITQRADNNRIEVVVPFDGSPASKAGIRPGDIIDKVEGKPVTGLGTPEIAELLKGPRGTTVHISLLRTGWTEPIQVTVQRDEIPKHDVDPPVWVRTGIGYIRIQSFQGEDTADDFTEYLRRINASGNLDGLIIDLRENGGGLLNAAIGISDDLLDRGQLIVTQRGRATAPHPYYATRGNQGIRVPLVILVDGNTASASEIVSGAVQDHDRGLILGERTFGKGLVQSVTPLSEGTGLALTTAQYYTPSGRWIQRDYKAVSLFDYQYNHNTSIRQTDVKLTDSGRTVIGGGGITPDVPYDESKLDSFEQTLRARNVFYFSDLGVGDFTMYFLGTKPNITKSFTVDDNVMKAFREFLDSKKINYTDQDIVDNADWIKLHIKREIFTSLFGQAEGYRVETEADPEIAKAADLIPQARELYDNARRILAQRAAGRDSNR
jgi:carboxyl-terminal processing protease